MIERRMEEKLEWLDELEPFTPTGFKLLKSAVEVSPLFTFSNRREKRPIELLKRFRLHEFAER